MTLMKNYINLVDYSMYMSLPETETHLMLFSLFLDGSEVTSDGLLLLDFLVFLTGPVYQILERLQQVIPLLRIRL